MLFAAIRISTITETYYTILDLISSLLNYKMNKKN